MNQFISLIIICSSMCFSYSQTEEINLFDNGIGLQINNEDFTGLNNMGLNFSSISFMIDKFDSPIFISIRHNITTYSFDSSNENIKRQLIQSLGDEVNNKSAGFLYLTINNSHNGKTSIQNIPWHLNTEFNIGIIPFPDITNDSSYLRSYICKANLVVEATFEKKIIVTDDKRKKVPASLNGSFVLAMTHVFTNSQYDGEKHFFFKVFQDEKGNQASPTAIIYGSNLSFSREKFQITIGYNGRIPFRKLGSERNIYGLQPRGFLLLKLNLGD